MALGLAAVLAVVLAAGSPEAVAAQSAPGGTALDRFLEGLSSWQADFSQSVVDAAGKELETGAGALVVRRPGRFRWEYNPQGGSAQLLVADGTNLWYYDRDLAQATVKPAAAALTATPIVLLSGSAAEVRAAFTIIAVGGTKERGGADSPAVLSWVAVTPRSATADFSSAELGFHGAQLERLVVHDRLNQTLTLRFTGSARNARIDDARLHFAPPVGVDVIGTAQP